MIFVGAGFCLKEKGIFSINLVLGLLTDKAGRFITFLATGLTKIFMGYLWWYLFKMVSATYRYQSTSGTLTNTPLWIPQTLMLVGAAGFLIQLAATTIKTYQAIDTQEEVV